MGIARMQTKVPYSITIHGEITCEFKDKIKEFIKSPSMQEMLNTIGIPVEYNDKLMENQGSSTWIKDMMLMQYHPKNATKFIITDIELEENYMTVTVNSTTEENIDKLENLRISCPIVSKDEEGKITIHFLHFVI
jgi:hypothetical protein